MKQLSILLLMGTTFLLCGCPLKTAVPIDEGSYKSTSWLEGRWTQQKADGSEGKSYLVKKGNAPGKIFIYSITNGTPETIPKPAVISSVGSRIFVSVYEPGDDADDKGYYIFQLVKQASTALDLLPVKEYSLSSEAPATEIREYLTQRGGGDIYELNDVEHYKKNR